MKALYRDEYGEQHNCTLLNNYDEPLALIELDGEKGTCSWNLIEIIEWSSL